MRQEIGRLIHQVDPDLFILDRRMHMHPADQHAVGKRSKIGNQPIITLITNTSLILTSCERVRRGRQHHHAEVLRDFRDTCSQFLKLMPNFADIPADRRTDFDL